MYLNETEEKMLKGEFGSAPQMAMRVLSKLGEKFGAEKMIPINCAHCILRGNYPREDPSELEYLQKLTTMGAKVSVPTDQNPAFAGWTKEDYRLIQASSQIVEIQDKCSECMSKMGATLNYTCTPYMGGNVPRFGENIAWCESSAVIYANSVIGARTNRYTAYLDWLIAIAGKVPAMGRHLTENRKADAIIRIDPKIEEWQDFDYASLGHFIGTSLGSDYTPVIENFPKSAQTSDLIQLGGNMATYGGISMYHIVGVTPEARTLDYALQDNKPRDELTFDLAALKKHREQLGGEASGKVDVVVFGCPHATLAEVMKLVNLLGGRKPKAEIHLFVSRLTSQQCEDSGLSEQLRRSGVLIFPSNCYSTGILRAKALGLEGIMTNSGKAVEFEERQLYDMKWMFGSMKECVEAAIRGNR